MWDLAWLDGITTDQRWEKLFEAVWDRVSPCGGLVMVHSTLTNAVNRPWLRGLLQSKAQGAAVAGEAIFRFLPAQAEEDDEGDVTDASTAAPEVAAKSSEQIAAALVGRVKQLNVEANGLVVDWSPAGEGLVMPLGFGLIAVELRAAFCYSREQVRADTDALAAAASSVLEAVIEEAADIAQSGEVVSVQAESGGGGPELSSVGLLEPHKRFQNSVSIFQRRANGYTEPLYSWTP
eukprot:SAG31_NODE_1580_length_7835_cov_4.074457_2_plen_235_part_00